MPKQPVFADFPDECKRLEVIAPANARTKRERPRNGKSRVIGAEPTPSKSRKGTPERKKRSNARIGADFTNGTGRRPEAAEIAEEFDLRRAVIYSGDSEAKI